ncbi:hypothetical protein T03_2573 [Trichinella britovi]|uniref:Uncharacterized protein n=1 Tax=Trichinella britovi TaxID=45882 RepID=A0A0V1C4G8_TRIBR|nr:hypothetical protein T03_2573 [Trichinella britovi]
MDEARRITLKTILIEEASYGMWLISRQDDRLPHRARLEKLEECCMRPLGNQTTREPLQPLRFLNGSSGRADDPLALATQIVIDDMRITQLKIQGFSIQFLLASRLWKFLFNNRNWKVVQDQLAKEGL